MGLEQIAHDNTVFWAGMTPTGVPYAWAWLGICIEGDADTYLQDRSSLSHLSGSLLMRLPAFVGVGCL